MPNVYVIGGANGSGKTTVSMSLLPNFLDCFEYVNADAIAFSSLERDRTPTFISLNNSELGLSPMLATAIFDKMA